MATDGSIKSYVVCDNPRTWDHKCLKVTGYEAAWPISEVRARLSKWLDLSMVQEMYVAGRNGDFLAASKLKTIQPLALRLLPN